MHEFLDKLTVEELAHIIADTDMGIETLKGMLHKTQIDDKFDKFLEETAEIISYLFTHFRKE